MSLLFVVRFGPVPPGRAGGTARAPRRRLCQSYLAGKYCLSKVSTKEKNRNRKLKRTKYIKRQRNPERNISGLVAEHSAGPADDGVAVGGDGRDLTRVPNYNNKNNNNTVTIIEH